jgi:hypothetical protein
MLFPTAVVFCYIKNVQNIIHDMNIDDCMHHDFVASKFSFDSLKDISCHIVHYWYSYMFGDAFDQIYCPLCLMQL